MAKTVAEHLSIRAWYDEDQDVIKLGIKGQGLTSVSNDPTSARGNPSLYKKLAAALRAAGKKYPAGIL